MRGSTSLCLIRRSRVLFLINRYILSRSVEGVQATFNESSARNEYNSWLESLWFAPNKWTNSSRDSQTTVEQRLLPFWNVSLQASVQCSLELRLTKTTGDEKSSIQQKEWKSISMSMSDLSLTDLNTYAAQALDREHVSQLGVFFNDRKLVSYDRDDKRIEKWTIDPQRAFNIGYDLVFLPRLTEICIQQAKKIHGDFDDYRMGSFHFEIQTIQAHLLHYPVFVITYPYGRHSDYRCLVDGCTGRVVGERQYSAAKLTLTTLLACYSSTFIVSLFLRFLFYPEFGLILQKLLCTPHYFFYAFGFSSLVGLYYQDLPRLNRLVANQQQWGNNRSTTYQSTYNFKISSEQQLSSERSSPPPGMDHSSMYLYDLLSVSPTASDQEIRQAYLIKAKQFHPDRNPGNRQAEEELKRVNQAYTILSDEFKRKNYDQHGYESVKYN